MNFIFFGSRNYWDINKYSTLDQVGIYSIGYTMGYAIMIIVGACNNAWPQMMFTYSGKKEAGIFYGKSFTYYAAILGLVWTGVTLFSKGITIYSRKIWD